MKNPQYFVVHIICISIVTNICSAQNFKVLYSFHGGNNAALPNAGIIRDPSGNIYGTTEEGGGNANGGTIYELNVHTHTEAVIYSFPTGQIPYGLTGTINGLPVGYGTTDFGGLYGSGSVFQVDLSGIETDIYSFTGGSDGFDPTSGVIHDAKGNLYGNTLLGGDGAGTVFKLSPNQNGWTETTLHEFKGNGDGNDPVGSLLLNREGNLYGATFNGGVQEAGAIFKIDPVGNETIVYSFLGYQYGDGQAPNGGLIEDSKGTLYGTTYSGGTGEGGQCGIVFKIDSNGRETIIHDFQGPEGCTPTAGLVMDRADNLYGTTYYGGNFGAGVVFKIDSHGNETVIHSFNPPTDGGGPAAALTLDGSGNLYGTALYGGDLQCDLLGDPQGCGTVFVISPK